MTKDELETAKADVQAQIDDLETRLKERETYLSELHQMEPSDGETDE